MLKLPKFEFSNFDPREGVPGALNSMLNIISEIAPSDATCSAYIEKIGRKFVFEIKIYSSVGTFTSRKDYDMQEFTPLERVWHVPVVRGMCRELRSELKSWVAQRTL